MLYFDDILTYLIIGIVALIIPGLLTIWNIPESAKFIF